MFAMLYVAFLTVYEHYQLDDETIGAILAKSNEVNKTHNASAQDDGATSASSNFKTITSNTIRWLEPLAIVPVLCFAYQTHEVIVPVYACMKQRSIGHFMKASIFGLVILFFLYNLVGAYGYLTFGEQVGADIMSLYDAKDPVVVIGIVALVIKFITTYPPLMFCGRGALDGLYGEIRHLSSDEFKRGEKSRRIIISTVWFHSTVLLAIFAPDISVTLQLLGSMASINVFVFPGLCLVSLTRRLRRARKALLIHDDAAQDYYMNGYGTASQLLPPAPQRQRAKDYYLISGSFIGAAMRKEQQLLQRQQQQQLQRSLRSTIIENGQAYQSNHNSHLGILNDNGNSVKSQQFTATFASLMEFENNFTNHYHSSTLNNTLNNTINNSTQTTINGEYSDLNNTVATVLDPSLVAQVGISRCTALGLYIYSAIIIIFGTFIFVLELVTVFFGFV